MDVRRKWTLFLSLPGRPRRNETFGEQLEDLKRALAKALAEVGNYNREVSRQREARSPGNTLTKVAFGQISCPSIVRAGKEWIRLSQSKWGDLTTTKYTGIVEDYLVFAPFADLTVNQIQRHDLFNWFLSLRQGEDKISSSQLGSIYSVVNQIFDFQALTSGQKIPNPATGLRKDILPKGHPKPETPPNPFNEEQLREFFNLGRRLVNVDELIVLSLMGRAGLRLGEALAVKRQNYLQKQNQYWVKQQYTDGKYKLPKHGVIRVVSLSPSLADELNNHIAVTRPGQEQLLCGKRSGALIQPFSRTRIRRLIQRICDELGYERRSPHDLRHSFATIQILSGISPKQLQLLLGHKDVVTTISTYETLFSSRPGTVHDPCEVKN
jgi:integrase